MTSKPIKNLKIHKTYFKLIFIDLEQKFRKRIVYRMMI